MHLPRTARERQSGATLVELLVSVVIIGLALALVVGTFSSGLLQATLAKRNTAATTVVEFEMNAVAGSQFNPTAQSYSDCFATETATSLPAGASAYQGSCPDATYTVRADVSVAPGPSGSQQWTVTVVTWPAQTQVGGAVAFLKVNR